MSFEYWYVFPVSILIATIAMASGVGGAVFFSPFFILVLGIPPEVGIGTAVGSSVPAWQCESLIVPSREDWASCLFS